jgi:circadian clock protein KaiB
VKRHKTEKADDLKENYVLRLFITGNTPRSTRSITSVTNFCRQFLAGHYELDVVDIYQQPTEARDNQIIAAPTLIKSLPLPLCRMIGDFSDQERVASGLGLVDFAG